MIGPRLHHGLGVKDEFELWVAHDFLAVHDDPEVFPHDGNAHQADESVNPLGQASLEHVTQTANNEGIFGSLKSIVSIE